MTGAFMEGILGHYHSFDFVIALDVLEHIENDQQILKEFYRISKVGGRIMLTVPAYQFLWGSHDELYSHKRRYQRTRLERMIEKAGFKVEKISYVYVLFFIPLYFLRRFKKFLRLKKDDFIKFPPALNRFLTWLNGLELHCLTKFNLPFGTSIFCIGKKEELGDLAVNMTERQK
ncbi:MAG: methyltransferase domain-containing protein [Actinomycetota bacterium]|nr:methyltransferase domain-containing protein [Actinomycetota bacterium]